MLTGQHEPSPNERPKSTGTAELTGRSAPAAVSTGSKPTAARRNVPGWVLPAVLAAGWLAVVLSQLRLLWVAAPMAALFAGETLLCWALYGNPMARIHAITHHAEGPAPIEIARTFRDKPRSTYIVRLPKILREYPEGNWMIAFIGLTLAGGAVWRRRLAIPVVWCALLWVPLTLLGGVLDPSTPKLRLQLIRYWFPIFPAFVLGGLGALWLAGCVLRDRLRDRPGGRGDRPGGRRITAAGALPVVLVVAVAAATVGTAARGWWALPGSRAGGGTQLEAFRSWMSDHEEAAPRIWTDAHTARLLAIYQHGPFGGVAWHARIGRATPGHLGARPGDLVLFFDTANGRLCGRCRKSARQVWGPQPRPLPDWREVYATRDGVVQVYQVLPPAPAR